MGVPEYSLAGRHREIAELVDAVTAAADGRGSLFLISGEPGIGKTRLAAAAGEHAAEAGHLVLWGRAWESGGAPPFWPWTQVLRGCERLVDPQLLADAAGGTSPGSLLNSPSAPGHTVAPEDRFGLYDAATALLLRLSDAVPLTVVLDDLHAADEPSLQLLRFATGQLAGARILLIGTYREIEAQADPTVAGLLGEAARQGLHLPLRGLDQDGVRALVDAHLGSTDEAFVTELHERTGGNPFLVSEILRLHRSGDPGARVPGAAREVIRRRLDQLPANAVQLLDAAAVVGRSFSALLLQHLLDLSPAEVLERLSPAEEVGIVVPATTVGTWQFAHGLIRETLYEDLPESERASTHGRLVEVLEALYRNDRSRHLSEIAHHAVAAVPVADAQRAVDYLVEAAEHATATLAHEEAARLLERALGLAGVAGGGDHRRAELLIRLMEAHAAAGRLDEVERLYEETAEVARRAELSTVLARAALARSTVMYDVWKANGDRIRVLREALEALGDDDTTLRALLLARLVSVLFYTNEPLDELAAEALDEARRSGDPVAVTAALNAQRHAIGGRPVRREHLVFTDEAILVSTAAGRLDLAAQSRYGRTCQLTTLGDIAAVERELDRFATDARAGRSPFSIWNSMAARVMPELLRGRWERAAELASEAATYGMRMHSPLTMSVWGVQTFIAMLERDQLEELLSIAETLPPEFRQAMVTRTGFMWVMAMVGRQEEARAELEAIAADGFALLPPDTTRYGALVFTAGTAMELGDRRLARELIDLLEPYAGLVANGGAWASMGPFDLYRGQLYALLEQWDRAERCLVAAERLAASMGSTPWEAHARFELAKVLIERGADLERAGELLEDATVVADELGMHRLSRMIAEFRDGSGAVPTLEEAPTPSFRFEREGEYWTIGGTSPFRLKDTKGLRYLAHLLANPETEIHVMALAQAESGVGPSGRRQVAPEDGSTGSFPSDAGPILDAQAKAAYKRRIADLQDEIDEATAFNDPERRAKAEEELDFLLAELSRSTGLGGRDRRASSPVEQTRVNVTKTIRSALKRIAGEDPGLGAFLDATVRTGTYCAYEPSRVEVRTWDTATVVR